MANRKNDPEGNMKITEDKRQWSLLPWAELEEAVKVFEEGLKQGYEKDDWEKGKIADYEDALIRHFVEYKNNKHNLMLMHSHLGAVVANALILIRLRSIAWENDNVH